MDLYQFIKDDSSYLLEIDKLITSNGISLFGAGQYGFFCSEYLIKNNYKVNYFIDNDNTKWNTNINGIKVCPKTNISKDEVILITSNHAVSNIMEDIKDNYKYVTSFDKWFIYKNYEKFKKIYDLLSDNISKKTLECLIYSKFISNKELLYTIYDPDIYFSYLFKQITINDIFLDAGAYCGDTIEKFIYKNFGVFTKIYAFEPGKKQFNAMNKRLERLKNEWAIDDNKIEVINMGLSDKLKSVNFLESNILTYCKATDSNEYINKMEFTSVDEYLDTSSPITFLKADIEGEELNMLKGAENTIKKYKPKMAISVYHRPDDLFSIFEYIKKLVPEYAFFLRHHSISFDETVLYCWVDKQ